MALTTRLLEELTLNGWPALQTLAYDGWLLRLADGYRRRANSVQPLDAGSLDLEAKVAHCEAVYRGQHLPVIFKLTDAAQPSDLDSYLAQRGYRAEATTSMQTAELIGYVGSGSPGVMVRPSSVATDAWLDAYCRLSGVATHHRGTMGRMLGSLVPPARFTMLIEDGAPIAMGLAVFERGYLGFSDIIVAADQRRRGHGRRLMDDLLTWGAAHGAHTAYLAVMTDNAPALALYAGLGFREQYRYWYRVLDSARTSGLNRE